LYGCLILPSLSVFYLTHEMWATGAVECRMFNGLVAKLPRGIDELVTSITA